jgi:hypothetical protein
MKKAVLYYSLSPEYRDGDNKDVVGNHFVDQTEDFIPTLVCIIGLTKYVTFINLPRMNQD